MKIGAPHFVDFGKNMEHSPDGKAYLVAHGSDLKFYPVKPENFAPQANGHALRSNPPESSPGMMMTEIELLGR